MNAVAASGKNAIGKTAVGVLGIAVVAIFISLDLAVATNRLKSDPRWDTSDTKK